MPDNADNKFTILQCKQHFCEACESSHIIYRTVRKYSVAPFCGARKQVSRLSESPFKIASTPPLQKSPESPKLAIFVSMSSVYNSFPLPMTGTLWTDLSAAVATAADVKSQKISKVAAYMSLESSKK